LADGISDVIRRELALDPRIKSPNTQQVYHAELKTFEDWRAERPLSTLLVDEAPCFPSFRRIVFLGLASSFPPAPPPYFFPIFFDIVFFVEVDPAI
jgi:hypothetical protein